MFVYEVGKQFPQPKSSQEGPIVNGNSGFVDLILYLDNPTSKEVRDCKSGMLTIGVYAKDTIPFLLIKIYDTDLSFDAPYNASVMLDTEWLRTDNNILNFFLVERQTNVLKAMRMLGLNDNLVSLFKSTAGSQTFQTKEEYMKAVNKIYSEFDFDAMYGSSVTQTFIR